MSYRQLPPPAGGPTGNPLERFVATLMRWMVWGTLALMALVFALSLLIWLVVMTVFSLVASVFTGRPAAVTVLWRRWREMTRQRWPQRPDAGTTTPRADAADATGASMPALARHL
ncbi:MAG: hypothetical protein LCH89_22105, partial [Proteobacteria bacterium]|nr:hypothetical protein [Pseudomonadota bacterium]